MPAAMGHLVVTRTLDAADKRVWIRELTGAQAFSAIAEYMRSPDLRASAADAAVRRSARSQT
jgi:hypothetical protein